MLYLDNHIFINNRKGSHRNQAAELFLESHPGNRNIFFVKVGKVVIFMKIIFLKLSIGQMDKGAKIIHQKKKKKEFLHQISLGQVAIHLQKDELGPLFSITHKS